MPRIHELLRISALIKINGARANYSCIRGNNIRDTYAKLDQGKMHPILYVLKGDEEVLNPDFFD